MSGAVFLDFRKAFDLVRRDILLKEKTYPRTTEASLVTFLRSCLQDRLQCVLINGTYPQETSVTSGMPQTRIDPSPSFVLHLYR